MTEITQTIPETHVQVPTKQNPIKEDIRQSDNWAECLKLYNWNTFKTSNGNNIYILKTPVGGFVKIQRPKLLNESELDEIDKICKENNALFIKLDPNIGQDLHMLKQKGYRLSKELLCPSLTLYINMEKMETELWNGLSHSAKYSINRAKREGAYTELVQNPDEEQLEKFYKVYLETAKYRKLSIKNIADLKKRVEVFKNESYIVFVYDKEKNLVGCKFYLGHKGNIWYIYGGTSSKGRVKSKAGYLLMWSSILYFKEKGYKYLDLEGISDPRLPKSIVSWGGFSHFKERFNGTLVEFPWPQIKYFSPILKIINLIYGRYVTI